MRFILPETLGKVTLLLMQESINIDIRGLDLNQLWETLTLDKKNIQGRMTFVLPEALGKVSLIDNINKKEVMKALEEFKKEWGLC